MKTLYFECNSGISGDMTVASLLDLGADEAVLRQGLESLHVDGYEIAITRVKKSGIDACSFDVKLEEEGHGDHGHDHDHGDGDKHGHDHGHEHKHDDHGHSHVHRNLTDIVALISGSGISEGAKEMAKKIFAVVAAAEAKVHGVPVDQVHFHEVGAVDSIVDIVGTAICVDNLGVDSIICSPLKEGTGTVKCQHGIMPVPAPATLEIMNSHKIPFMVTDNKGEMVTPTGAAIVAALADEFGRPEEMVVSATGYGAGKKEFATANVLRTMIIEEAGKNTDDVLGLECNLDDMTGEHLAFACEKLLEAGALDVWCTPVTMKKSRPGQVLSVLCAPYKERDMVAILLRHTSTIGVRVSRYSRHVMSRSMRTTETAYGELKLKDCVWNHIRKTTVEYESAKALADAHGVPIDAICRAAFWK